MVVASARPWLETAGVLLLGVAGYGLGRLCSRLRSPYWAVGYVVPLVLVGMISAARRVVALEFIAPFSWLMAGRVEFALMPFLGTMLLATPLSRLREKRQRGLVVVFVAIVVVYFTVVAFLMPAVTRGEMARLTTRMTNDGVCLQGRRYTCGPAAAVTALRHLRLHAEEGELAILAYTSSFSGTQPDLLCSAMRKRYAVDGLSCEYRAFHTVDELRDCCPAVALVKFGPLVDHYVAVLDVGEYDVRIGDPLVGMKTLSHEEFERIWRRCGIVLHRDMIEEPAELRAPID